MRNLLYSFLVCLLVFMEATANAQQINYHRKDLLFLVEFNSYDEWYQQAFKTDALRRSNFCKEEKTTSAIINNESALVVLRDFQMSKMKEFTSNEQMANLMKKHQISHPEVYEMRPLTPQQMAKGKVNLFFIVESVDYDMWLWDAFLPDGDRRSLFCDEERTRVAKIDDKKAMVVLYDFDLTKLTEFQSDEKVADLMKKYHVSHDVYLLAALD